MTRALVLVLLTCVASVQVRVAATPEFGPSSGPVTFADWQYPQSLPPRFRNHCSTEYFTGRPYCSDHCGGSYQFFFCSEGSFGCCHRGRGYCDVNGLLRCNP